MAATEKYLLKYAEPEVSLLTSLGERLDHAFKHCVCIPAYNEALEFVQRSLTFLSRHPSTLAIIVLNRPDSDVGVSTQNSINKTLIEDQAKPLWRNQHLQFHSVKTRDKPSAILLIDRFDTGEPIPQKQGVGLARKIAADIALALIDRRIIDSPWIYSTDADTLLPNNYFELPTGATNNSTAAFILAYKHIASGDTTIDQATQVYEQRLKTYVQGLKFAGSPYAFNTVGSTLCISARHYAMVRGFPKRAAGEDFYLLNKLRKTAAVKELTEPVVQIQSRISSRTPFGTGPAVAELLDGGAPNSAEIFYHPQLFVLLKQLLQGFENITAGFSDEQKTVPDWQAIFADSKVILSALEAMDFNQAITHCIENSRSQQQFTTHLMHWFDSFRTLKWLHFARDFSNCPNIDIEQHRIFVNALS